MSEYTFKVTGPREKAPSNRRSASGSSMSATSLLRKRPSSGHDDDRQGRRGTGITGEWHRDPKLAGEPGDIVAVGAALVVFDQPTATSMAGEPPVETSRDKGNKGLRPLGVRAPLRRCPKGSDPLGSDPVVTDRRYRRNADPSSHVAGYSAPRQGGRHVDQNDSRVWSRRAQAARESAGVDFDNFPGTGPIGRNQRRDFGNYLKRQAHRRCGRRYHCRRRHGKGDQGHRAAAHHCRAHDDQSKREIPHFAYVEEVDITEAGGTAQTSEQQDPGSDRTADAAAVPRPCLDSCIAGISAMQRDL